MSITIPDLPFGAQLIGRTEKSLDALLKHVLADRGLSEPEYVALRVCADHEGAARAEVIAQLSAAFRRGEQQASELLERLSESDLIRSDGAAAIALTVAGRELHSQLVRETGTIADRLWGDLPGDELLVAGRVLSEVLRRAATEPV